MSGSDAPYFEDLHVGLVERAAPAITLTDGLAAVHQAIVGDRLALALDATLAREVTGSPTALAHPALVWDVAIGQSTLLTRRVIANLFYRGLVLARAPSIGDTLATTTEVVALRRTSPRADRPPSGLAVLRVRTVDQAARPVLDFWRCAMLPLRDASATADRESSLQEIPAELDARALRAATASWRLDAFAGAFAGAGERRLAGLAPGTRWSVDGGDVVSAAPELARLSLNVATAHHDAHAHADRRRLVYGGHTIGLAAAQACRSLPEIATIVAWHSCDHLAPVHEHDTLHSELELERIERLDRSGALAHLRSRVVARGASDDAAEATPVLDWSFVAVVA